MIVLLSKEHVRKLKEDLEVIIHSIYENSDPCPGQSLSARDTELIDWRLEVIEALNNAKEEH